MPAPYSKAPPDTCDRCAVTTSNLYASADLGWICERCAFVLDPDALHDHPWDWADDYEYES